MWPTWTCRAKRAAASIAAVARGAPQGVDRDVEVTARGGAVGRGEIVLGVQRHRGVGAMLEQALEPLPTAVGRHDPARTEQLRDLHRERPERAAPEHEHGVARLEARAPRHREPGAHPGVAQRRGGDVVDAVVELEQRGLARERALGHRPERRDRLVEVHVPAVLEATDAVRADRARQRRRAHVERAARLQQVEVMQARRGDVHDDGARLRLRVLERPVAGRFPVLVEDGGVHSRAVCQPWR